MVLILIQTYDRKYADIEMLEKQLSIFSEYTNFEFYIDRRSCTIQIYDNNDICQEKLTYINQNLRMIINYSSCN